MKLESSWLTMGIGPDPAMTRDYEASADTDLAVMMNVNSPVIPTQVAGLYGNTVQYVCVTSTKKTFVIKK